MFSNFLAKYKSPDFFITTTVADIIEGLFDESIIFTLSFICLRSKILSRKAKIIPWFGITYSSVMMLDNTRRLYKVIQHGKTIIL